MASFNRVVLMGNITRDPQVRYLQSGIAVCDLGLAVNERRKGPNGESIEEVTFVDVTLWERSAEIAGEYLRKGSPVLIEGRLKMDRWTDKNDGQPRTKLKVTGDRLVLVGTRGGPQGEGDGGPGRSEEGPPPQQQQRPAARSSAPSAPPRQDYDSLPQEPSGGDDIPF